MAVKNFLSREAKREKKTGTAGSFSAKARRAGKSTSEFASEHDSDNSHLAKQSRLAETYAKFRKH
jgi:hypothetical protein